MTYSPNSYTTTTEVLVKSATTTGVNVKVLDSTLPSGAATSANQVTGNNSLSNIENKIVGLTIIAGRLQVELPSGGGGLTDAELRASPVPVTVTGTVSVIQSGTWNVNISATALPLPTGAASASNQTNGTQKTQLVDAAGDVVDVVQLSGAPVGTEKGLVTQSIIHGLNAGGGGTYVDVKVNPAGKLLVTADLEQGGTAVGAANPVQVTLANTGANATAVKVDGSAVNQPVTQSGTWNVNISATALPLMTGLTTVAGRLQVDTQGLTNTELRASPVPTVLTSSSVTILNNIGITGTVTVTGALTDTQLRATPVPVVLTSSSITILGGAVAISGTVSVVQSGTWNVNVSSTSLDSINTKTPNLGQTTAAGSTPVVIASNQTTIPVALTASSVTLLAGTNNIGDVDILSIAAGDNNIGNVDIVTAPTLSINPIIATQAATTSLGATVAAQTVAALNANRLGLYVFNEVESGFMYLRYGANASAGSYSIRIAAGGFWEMPQPIFTGQITAAFSVSTTTSAKVTEVTK